MNNKNEISLFEHEQFGELRVLGSFEKPQFIARDVCRILGITNVGSAMQRLKDHEKGVCQADTLGGTQTMTTITESGFYRLVLRSDKPFAETFQDWVVEEVLPSIRNHGIYATPEKLAEMLQKPESIITILTTLAETQEKLRSAEQTIEEQADKVERCINYLAADEDDEKSINWLAKTLTQDGYRFSDKQLFAWLRERGILQKQKGANWNIPYQRYIDLGWFKLKETSIVTLAGTKWSRTTYVTRLGMMELPKRIKKWCDRNMAVA